MRKRIYKKTTWNKQPKKTSDPLVRALEKPTWDIFSLDIRLRDCDEDGNGFCATCGKPLWWFHADAGHYENRACKAIKYDRYNVNLQCKYDNGLREGMKDRYANFIERKYGVEKRRELNMKAKLPHKFTTGELMAIFNTSYRNVRDSKFPEAQKKIKKILADYAKCGGIINEGLSIK
jgi:hypothetical protein